VRAGRDGLLGIGGAVSAVLLVAAGALLFRESPGTTTIRRLQPTAVVATDTAASMAPAPPG